ncbi:MAG: DoxX family protein [Bacteroidia bacterium]
MKATNITYWVSTVLFALFIIGTSIPDVISNPDAIKIVTTHLGYPAYFIPFIGVAKILGGIALLIPGFPRIKEWAYAGLTFDLIAATYSSIAVGDPAKNWCFMFIFFVVLFTSYFFYHKRLKATIK